MVNEVYVYHDTVNYFGRKQEIDSRVMYPDKETVLKALDKFSRRMYEHHTEVMHIDTDKRHMVLRCVHRELELGAHYGYNGSFTGFHPIALRDMKDAVAREFE